MRAKLVSEILESFGQKDYVRMTDIRTKSAGDHEKELSLAGTQAKIIKNAVKAKARGEAAEEVFGAGSDIAQIFYDRASELGGDYVEARASKGALAPVKAAPKKGEKLEREFKKGAMLPSERVGYKAAEEQGGGFSRGGFTKPGEQEGSVYQKMGLGRYANAPETSDEVNYSPYSILPLGSVDIGSGESKYFNVYDEWPDSTAEIWKTPAGKYKILFTSGDKPIGKIGLSSNFRHDQTWNEMTRDGMWKMVDYVPVKDMQELIRVYGKSMFGYTYK